MTPSVCGIYLYLVLCSICLLSAGDGKGLSRYVSDWRGVHVDYATNAIVANHYNPGMNAKWFRAQNAAEIKQKMDAREPFTIGIDYYYLYSVSLHHSGIRITDTMHKQLLRGHVFVVQIGAN